MGKLINCSFREHLARIMNLLQSALDIREEILFPSVTERGRELIKYKVFRTIVVTPLCKLLRKSRRNTLTSPVG